MIDKDGAELGIGTITFQQIVMHITWGKEVVVPFQCITLQNGREGVPANCITIQSAMSCGEVPL